VPEIAESLVSFSLRGDTLDPEDVSRLLGVAPTHTFRRGDPISSRNPENVHQQGLWYLESELPLGAILDAHLQDILQRLLPVADQILRLLELGAEGSFRVALLTKDDGDPEGTTLSVETVAGMAALRAPLGITVYAGGASDSESS
jgi:hypothetical protein